jgi:hypothetical protein
MEQRLYEWEILSEEDWQYHKLLVLPLFYC